MTSIGAKPWWVYQTSSPDEAMERVLELVDVAVGAAQKMVDQRHADLLADRPSLVPTADQLEAACDAWIRTPHQRQLLNACAWVQLGDWFYGYRNLLHSSLEDARRDTAAMGHAATLMLAVNNAPMLNLDQWCSEITSPAAGSVTMSLMADPSVDGRLSKEVKSGRLLLPLVGFVLGPATAEQTVGAPPRWTFEILGAFRAIPVRAAGVTEPMLICGGQYSVESVTEVGPTTRVQLSYQDRLGDAPVTNPVLLEIAGLIPNVVSTWMEGPKSLHGLTYRETITLGLTANREFEATFDSRHPDRIATRFRPDGAFDPENRYTDGWEFSADDGPTVATLPADARLITGHVERLRDPLWLEFRRRLLTALGRCWRTTGEPWESSDSIDLPGGGYVQWTRVDDPGSDVHIEINEGNFADPMPAEFAQLLVILGWNAPDDDFRNCWLRAAPSERGMLRTEGRGFFVAANLILLGVTIAMGVSLTELWPELGGGEHIGAQHPGSRLDH